MRLKHPCLYGCFGVALSNCSCSASLLSPSFFSIYASLYLPLFLGPLITPINVRGEVLGQVFSSSQSISIAPKIQSLVISAR